ncbi:MAG: acyl--CoA ligase, partial [Candidatus Aminicenantes bacterium]|nr:acyl--CoA ligase [Candidatus Aminicenantes bacterium]
MISIECPVYNSSIKFPDKIALIEGEMEISYLELNRRIDSARQALMKHDVKPGMKVGIISENSIQYIVLIFSLLRIGSLAVPINFRFRYTEIKEIISGMGIDLVISDMFTDDLDNSGIPRIGLNNTAGESGVNEGKAEKVS